MIDPRIGAAEAAADRLVVAAEVAAKRLMTSAEQAADRLYTDRDYLDMKFREQDKNHSAIIGRLDSIDGTLAIHNASIASIAGERVGARIEAAKWGGALGTIVGLAVSIVGRFMGNQN